MKKLIFLLLFLPSIVLGQTWQEVRVNPYILGVTETTVDYDCMTGTYTLGWTGDWPSDTDKACAGSGDTTGVNGTITGSPDIGTDYGEGGSVGIKCNAVNEYLTYTQTAGQYISGNAAYTVWVRVYVSEIPTGNTKIFDFIYDSSNFATFHITSARELVGTWKGGAITASAYGAAISVDTWTDIAYSWDQPNQDHSANTSGSWEDDNNEITDSMTNDITNLSMGTKSSFSMAAGEFIQIDKWAIVSGYKASKPAGW